MQSFLIREFASGNGFLVSLTLQILLSVCLVCWPGFAFRMLSFRRRRAARSLVRIAILLFGLLPAFWPMPIFAGWSGLQAVLVLTFIHLTNRPRRYLPATRLIMTAATMTVASLGWATELLRWGKDVRRPEHIETSQHPSSGSRLSVLVVGDSLSSGIRGRSQESWPSVLSNRTGWIVSNDSQPADTTDAVAERWSRAEPARLRCLPQPRFAVVLLGGNDMLNGRPSALMEQDLASILRCLEVQKYEILLVELPLLPLGSGYGLAQIRLAKQHDAELLPRRRLAQILADPMATHDGLHLTALGASRLSLWIEAEIQQMFSRNKQPIGPPFVRYSQP
jgi:acyl-CoA thioesterase-1